MKVSKKRYKYFPYFFYILLFVIVASLISCGKGGLQKNIFRYNESSGIATLDPAFAKNQSIMWALHHLYNTLLQVDDSLHIIPSLAHSWKISEDNLTFTFYLRNDVFFHDDAAFENNTGRKLTAYDAEYSFKRLMNKSTASSGAWIFNDKADSIEPFKALNDTTFQLKLIKPFNPVLGILSMQYCSIVPHEAVEKYGKDFRRHPVGTGPFQFVAWEEGQALILKKNKKYFEKDEAGNTLPYINGIKISFYDNKATEFLEFQQKRLDFINDIDASFKDEILTRKGELREVWKNKIGLIKQPFLNTEYLGILYDTANILLKNSPFKNKKFRQAINYAIDRKKLILYLRNSLGTAAESGFIPLGLPSFSAAEVPGYYYDPAISAKLLKEMNYKFEPVKLVTIPVYADIGSFIANQLQQAGINAKVEIVQKSLLLEQTSKSQALFFRGSWIADYPDAENYLSVFYSKNPAPPNYTRYQNNEFDNLYEQSVAEKDRERRNELYRKADRIIINDAVVVPLWYDMVVRLYHNTVKNFTANSLNLLDLRRVKLEK